MFTKPFKIITANDNQMSQWDNHYQKDRDVFGVNPSESAVFAANMFIEKGFKKILELGAGQGRDTLYFASKGFNVHVIEYSQVAINDLKRKLKKFNLNSMVKITYHDLREPLPFKIKHFDACYSHMLFCMEFKESEILALNNEIYRVLKDKGYHCFTVRNDKDKEYGVGTSLGHMIYESGGFIVHYFDKEKIRRVSKAYRIHSINEFKEGKLPRRLYRVLLEKNI